MTQKEEAIRIRLKSAKSFIDDADIHLRNKLNRAAIYSLYYGCFHATKALLLTKDVAPKSHSGTIHLLHLHFANENEIDAGKATFYAQLMNKRIESDYGDSIIIEESEMYKYIEPAKEYFQYVTKMVEDYLAQ